jgi:hypothetical protein
MKPSPLLLLLLLTSWLLALPELYRATAPAPLAVVAASHDEVRAASAMEHLAAQSAMPQVPRAPLLARLAVEPPSAAPPRPAQASARSVRLHDLRAALRRVQTRRRVPRLGGGDPPWS